MIIPSKSAPVFITGMPRCGSSWVGAQLGRAPRIRYVYEPFNGQWSPALRGRLGHFLYLPREASAAPALEAAAERAFAGRQSWKQLARALYRGYAGAALRPAGRVLIKDPTAVLMADWLAERFGARIAVIVRHPCGFASSIAQLGWTFRLERLLEQERLMADHLREFEDTLRYAATDPWLARGAFWAAIHTVLADQLARHEHWRLCRFERLCEDPPGEFKALAQSLDVDWAPGPARARVSARSRLDPGSTRKDSAVVANAWKQRLSPAQKEAVLGVAREFPLRDIYPL